MQEFKMIEMLFKLIVQAWLSLKEFELIKIMCLKSTVSNFLYLYVFHFGFK